MAAASDFWPLRLLGRGGGSSIEDGGNDMYDGGNMMWLRVNGQWSPHALKYTQVCFGGDMGEGAGRGDAECNTCYLSSRRRSLRPSSPRRPHRSMASVSTATSALTARAFKRRARRLYNSATAPSTCLASSRASTAQATARPRRHGPTLASITSSSRLLRAPPLLASTDSDRHEVILEHGVGVLYYLLWGGTKGKQYVNPTSRRSSTRSARDASSAGRSQSHRLLRHRLLTQPAAPRVRAVRRRRAWTLSTRFATSPTA